MVVKVQYSRQHLLTNAPGLHTTLEENVEEWGQVMIDASERGRDRSYTFWKSDDGCCQASGADHGRPHVERLNARAVLRERDCKVRHGTNCIL